MPIPTKNAMKHTLKESLSRSQHRKLKIARIAARDLRKNHPRTFRQVRARGIPILIDNMLFIIEQRHGEDWIHAIEGDQPCQ